MQDCKKQARASFREAEFDIMYGQGISRSGDVLDLAVEANIVQKSGAWYSHNGDRIGQGRENAKTFLMENSDRLDQIEQAVLAAHGLVDPSCW